LNVSQINVNPGGGTRDSGMTSVIAIVLVLALIGFAVFAFGFGGLERLSGGPARAPVTSSAPAGPANTTINVEPKVNVVIPAPVISAPADAGTTPPKP
jgi:hypothetical protein